MCTGFGTQRHTGEIVAVHESQFLEEELDSQIAPSFFGQLPLWFG